MAKRAHPVQFKKSKKLSTSFTLHIDPSETKVRKPFAPPNQRFTSKKDKSQGRKPKHPKQEEES